MKQALSIASGMAVSAVAALFVTDDDFARRVLLHAQHAVRALHAGHAEHAPTPPPPAEPGCACSRKDDLCPDLCSITDAEHAARGTRVRALLGGSDAERSGRSTPAVPVSRNRDGFSER